MNIVNDTSEYFLRCQQLEGIFFYPSDSGITKNETDDLETFDYEERIKVGILANVDLRKALEQLTDGDVINNLMDSQYCRENFYMRHPILSVGRNDNNRDRYYKKPLKILEKEYYLCNDWYERNRYPLVKWMDDLNKG